MEPIVHRADRSLRSRPPGSDPPLLREPLGEKYLEQRLAGHVALMIIDTGGRSEIIRSIGLRFTSFLRFPESVFV
jgi:hypothetical protein